MDYITISKGKVEKQKGVVVLSLRQYQELTRSVPPTYYLSGGDGTKLDRLVEMGIKELRAGKTKKIKALADLD